MQLSAQEEDGGGERKKKKDRSGEGVRWRGTGVNKMEGEKLRFFKLVKQ